MGAPDAAVVAVGVAGAFVAGATVLSAVRTTVLPRGVPSLLSRVVFTAVRWGFTIRLGKAATYERRDRVFAGYAPISMMVLLQAWLIGVLIGFAGLHWSLLQHRTWQDAFEISGSSLFTLGFRAPRHGTETSVTFAEAGVGMLLVALLISYLPVIYGVFSRRELAVARIHVRAGSPPSGGELLRRAWAIDRRDLLDEMWPAMEVWFLEIEETHMSFPSLVFFRSPQPERSWVTAAGAVLDAAALLCSSVDRPVEPEPQLCLRAGAISLGRIADYYRIPAPRRTGTVAGITITRDEWERTLAEMAAAGVPIKSDREQAWQDFSGWRINYDRPLVALAGLTMAPYAPWSSDRSLARPSRVAA
jgi:hypothetical protein